MSNEPNDVSFVDPNTDDLNAFEDLLSGKAQPQESQEEEKVNPEEISNPLSEDEDDASEASEDEETTDDGQSDDDQEDEEDAEPKQKKPNRIQERINQLLERERLAKTEAAELRQKLAAAEQAKQTEQVQVQQPVQTGPTPDDKNPDGSEKYALGQYDPEYIRDLARFTIQQETEVARAAEQQAAAQRQHQEALVELDTQWQTKLAPVQEQYEDFVEKSLELESAFDGLDPAYSDYLVNTIKSLDHGPEVLYYFANNLEEASKIVQSGPLLATLALGKYNAMFEGTQSEKKPKVSKAPPPPQINKGTKTKTVVAGDTDDLDAFERELFSKKR